MDNLNKRVMSLEIKDNNKILLDRWNKSFTKIIVTLVFIYISCFLVLYTYKKLNIVITSFIPCILFIIYRFLINYLKDRWLKNKRSGGKSEKK